MNAADAWLFNEWDDARRNIPLGLTGLSQIYRHYQRHLSDEVDITGMKLDIQYGETASLDKDIALIARTPLELIKASLQN